MEWEQVTQNKLKTIVTKIPVFHRRITEEAVSKGAEENALKRGSLRVEEVDVITAFFSDVPAAFYSMMVRLLDQSGFDYKKYGFPQVKPKLTER